MLKSLLKGVGIGAGISVGQEIVGGLMRNRNSSNRNVSTNNSNNANNSNLERDIQCRACGEVNTGDSRFCGECGGALQNRITIASGVKCDCGYMNAAGQKFCSECGKGLANRN